MDDSVGPGIRRGYFNPDWTRWANPVTQMRRDYHADCVRGYLDACMRETDPGAYGIGPSQCESDPVGCVAFLLGGFLLAGSGPLVSSGAAAAAETGQAAATWLTTAGAGLISALRDRFQQGASTVSSAASRLPQDMAVNPIAPQALPLERTISMSASQNAALQRLIIQLKDLGATGIRVNQQQVNIDGIRVGLNRPDLQYTLNGVRHYIEFETSSIRAALQHQPRILANDLFGRFQGLHFQ